MAIVRTPLTYIHTYFLHPVSQSGLWAPAFDAGFDLPDFLIVHFLRKVSNVLPFSSSSATTLSRTVRWWFPLFVNFSSTNISFLVKVSFDARATCPIHLVFCFLMYSWIDDDFVISNILMLFSFHAQLTFSVISLFSLHL